MFDKKPTTINEQIDILNSGGLTIELFVELGGYVSIMSIILSKKLFRLFKITQTIFNSPFINYWLS